MVNRFNINDKKLRDAKPCVIMLLRDSGNIEWYEDARSGQLFQIKTGSEKAYLNLDQNKIVNLIGDQQEQTEVHLEDKTTKEEKKFSIKQLIGKFNYLSPNKKVNFTDLDKPLYGFVCYEKEFNPLPSKPVHDSRQIASWLDYVAKNYKNFTAQTLNAIKAIVIVVAIAVVVGIAVYWFFGKDAIKAQAAAELAVATAGNARAAGS